MTKKEIDSKLTFGGRHIMSVIEELDRKTEVVILNGISDYQKKFLQKECGLSVKKAKENDQLLILTTKREIDEIDLQKYLDGLEKEEKKNNKEKKLKSTVKVKKSKCSTFKEKEKSKGKQKGLEL